MGKSGKANTDAQWDPLREVGAGVEFDGVIISVTEHAEVVSRAALKINIQITNPFFLFMSIIHLSYLGQQFFIFLYLYGYDEGV